VREENELIHHLFPGWDLYLIESCIATEQYLDQQREKILPEYEFLKVQIKTMNELNKMVEDFIVSDDFTNTLSLHL
jgi:hypothetical protein